MRCTKAATGGKVDWRHFYVGSHPSKEGTQSVSCTGLESKVVASAVNGRVADYGEVYRGYTDTVEFFVVGTQ